MNKGTNGCLYNCGDGCSGECISKEKHTLEDTLINLKDFKKELENHVIILDSGRGVSLSNLPGHFWESLGECINDIEYYLKNETNL